MSESGKAVPDQVTSRRFIQACAQIVTFCARRDIPSSIELANRLQGVARAASDIVLARGSVEVITVRGQSYGSYVLRRFENPQTQEGRAFVGLPDRGHGTSLMVTEKIGGSPIVRCRVRLPTDREIDELLMTDPVLWENVNVHAEDHRPHGHAVVYPFSRYFYRSEAAMYYSRTARILCLSLLRMLS